MPEAQDIHPFIEPIYRFCASRICNPYDAEDLSGEILLHVLDGLRKYRIDSLEHWIWRVAHNRYARFMAARSRQDKILSEDVMFDLAEDIDIEDDFLNRQKQSAAYQALMSIGKAYREIAVDYYVHELSIKALSKKFNLNETTVKWRLNVSREKIRSRIGVYEMERIYDRLNWETESCNGNLNPDRYLHSQLTRAICDACYEEPRTIEEISASIGVPALYLEDEIPRLIYGDAVVEQNGKYATNFIILRLGDREQMEACITPMVKQMANWYEKQSEAAEKDVKGIGFYGCDLPMSFLGHIALPSAMRSAVRRVSEAHPQMADGPYPVRQDGGHGWFLVSETPDSAEKTPPYTSGLNVTDGEKDLFYCNWIQKYFHEEVFWDGLKPMYARNIVPKCQNGLIPDELLSEEELAFYISLGLVRKQDELLYLNFPCFSRTEYRSFASLFDRPDEQIDTLIYQTKKKIRDIFLGCSPKRLGSQVNQWVSGIVHDLTGMITEELIARNILCKPEKNTGIFWCEGDEVEIFG